MAPFLLLELSAISLSPPPPVVHDFLLLLASPLHP